MKEQYISIGHTKKVHGAAGELKIAVKDAYLEDFLQSGVVFINVQGKPVPFFIEEVREAGDLIVKFEDVDSPGDAVAITSKELFLRTSDLLDDDERELPSSGLKFEKYTGFTIIDEDAGTIGEIKEVMEFPQQEMAMVAYKGNELMIPLHDDLIIQVDKKARTMTLRLPLGILDIG